MGSDPGRAESGRQAQVPEVPPGFDDTRVAKVPAPTSLAFLPDGRMLVSSQNGRLWLVEAESSAMLLDLGRRVCTRIEQGLLGMAVDPGFAENRFLYLFYTAKHGRRCVNRVSRFSLGDRVDVNSEMVLVDNIQSKRGNHNGGDVQFGPDGYLYVSVGDGGCHLDGRGCHGRNKASRDGHALFGKVLRLSSDGSVPPDNPYMGPGAAPCRMTGKTEEGKICEETFVRGLRNPFRMAFDRNAGQSRLFVNDPGQDRWEEVNEAVPGADFGWNRREGRCVNRSLSRCGNPPPGLTDPIFQYAHSKVGGCQAITGGAFVPQGSWPAPYGGSYLFADFVCGQIFRLEAAPEGFRAVKFAAGFGSGSLVHMTFGPYGGGSALYVTSYSGGGEIHRLSYRGEAGTEGLFSGRPT